MSMMQSEIKSSEAEGPNAGNAIALAVAALAIFALLGADVAVLAMMALLVFGSILILQDRSVTVEPHTILT